MGNTQASNAILAKARAMYGRRLTARNYQELLNCRDLPDLISYLKTRTSYSEALQAANPVLSWRRFCGSIFLSSMPLCAGTK